MEYVEGPLLFDMCKQLGNVGEDFGRYFAKQMIEQLEYMISNGIVHRDIKLENILMDKDMNLKLADFGFATNKHNEELTSFRGTQSYMAPEIRKQEKFNGKQTDIFSMGVVLFTLVVGYFPISTADLKDQFYAFLTQGERDANGINSDYWDTLKASDLSNDFKDLMQRIFSMDGNKRPTIEEIKNHPWFKNKINEEKEEQLRQALQHCHSQGENAKRALKKFQNKI
jgi:serine/threonine protein kinase